MERGREYRRAEFSVQRNSESEGGYVPTGMTAFV
jgi:hypothetical protein